MWIKKKHSSYREMQTNDLFGILKGAMIFHAISIPNSELGDNTTIWKHDILFLDEKKVKERFVMSGDLHYDFFSTVISSGWWTMTILIECFDTECANYKIVIFFFKIILHNML